MYHMAHVHRLLVKLPPTVDKKYAGMLEDFFFHLEVIDHGHVPPFMCDVLSCLLNLKDHKRGTSFVGLDSDMPAPLIKSVIQSMAYAFPVEHIKVLIKAYQYVLGIDRVIPKPERSKKNDATVFIALFDVLCPNIGMPQALGISADEYDLELTKFLVEAFQKRLFAKIEVSQGDQSEISSVLKKYFTHARVSPSRWTNILTITKSIHALVGDDMVFWGPPGESSLERVLSSEFSFKAFNCFLPEERIRMLASLMG